MPDCCFCSWCCADSPWTPGLKWYPCPSYRTARTTGIYHHSRHCGLSPYQGSRFGSSSLAFMASLPAAQEPSEITFVLFSLDHPPWDFSTPLNSSFSTALASVWRNGKHYHSVLPGTGCPGSGSHLYICLFCVREGGIRIDEGLQKLVIQRWNSRLSDNEASLS